MKYGRVGAVKVATEKGSNLLSSREVNRATAHLQEPVNNTERGIPVCGIDTYPKVWEGGREKQASKLAEQTLAKAHGEAPADLPGPPT